MTDQHGVNVDLLRQTMDAVLAHPDLHKQEMWATKTDCGTAYCFAGWVCPLSGLEADFYDGHTTTAALTDGAAIPDVARDLLGVDRFTSYHLFHAANTTADLKEYVDQIGQHGRVNHAIEHNYEVPW